MKNCKQIKFDEFLHDFALIKVRKKFHNLVLLYLMAVIISYALVNKFYYYCNGYLIKKLKVKAKNCFVIRVNRYTSSVWYKTSTDYLSLNHGVLQKKIQGHRLKSLADFMLFVLKLWCSLKKDQHFKSVVNFTLFFLKFWCFLKKSLSSRIGLMFL